MSLQDQLYRSWNYKSQPEPGTPGVPEDPEEEKEERAQMDTQMLYKKNLKNIFIKAEVFIYGVLLMINQQKMLLPN